MLGKKKQGKRNRDGKDDDAAAPPLLGGRFHAVNPPRITHTPYEEALGIEDLSSDDEAPKNTVGNVPLAWYAEESHIGYDLSGQRIARGKGKDGIDQFLASQDNPHHKWTIYDEDNDEEVVLSKRDVLILRRIRDSGFAHPEFEAYQDFVDTGEVEIHPLHSGPEPKRRFLPSKHEAARVNRIAKALKAGTYVVKTKPLASEEAPVYLLWGADGCAIGVGGLDKYAPPPLPAPRPPPPGHAASYNPPPEYLLSAEEEAAMLALPISQRPLNFVPKRFSALRAVPLYAAGVREAFERCLDLYLCPRAVGKRLAMDPEQLLPQLPDPAALRPFPCAQAHLFEGGPGGRTRALSCDPSGAWLVTGGEAGVVALWDIATGRCVRHWTLGAPIYALAWNPNRCIHLVAVAFEDKVGFLYPGTALSQEAVAATFGALSSSSSSSGGMAEEGEGEEEEEEEEEEGGEGSDSEDGEERVGEGGKVKSGGASSALEVTKVRTSKWGKLAGGLECAEDLLPPRPGQDSGVKRGFSTGIALCVSHFEPVRKLAWHGKGDYLAAATPSAPTGQVMVHQLSQKKSLCPFAKNLGQVQAVQWHPTKPLLHVANQRTIKVYDLVEGALRSKLEAGVQWISSLDVHPGGEHVVAGSYDHKTVWFDTELGTTPYKTLRYHGAGVRRAAFHQGGYPLMATCSDDGTLHVFHARVFPGDYSQNPVIVPVKILRGHAVAEGLGVLDFIWHPTQPWIVSTGADGKVILWRE
jgi:ribosome biogenesis protein ERB1